MNVQDVSLGVDKRRSLGNMAVTIGQGDSGGTTISAAVVDGARRST